MYVLLLLILAATAGAQNSCVVTNDKGHYDLTSLSSSKDYEVKVGDMTYYLNVCRALVGEIWNGIGLEEQDTGLVGGKYRGEHGDHSMGEFNSTLRFEHDNPLLLYDNGSPCAADMKVRASTAIRFLCDNNVFGSGNPQLVASLPPGAGTPCAFFFEWRTHVACPGAARTSIGSAVFLVLSMVLLFLTMVAILYILYRKYALKKHGFEILPRPSLRNIRETFHDLRDFLRPTRDRWRDGPRYGGRSYYETIAAEEENRPLHDEEGTRLSFEEGRDRPVNGPEESNNWER